MECYVSFTLFFAPLGKGLGDRKKGDSTCRGISGFLGAQPLSKAPEGAKFTQ